MKVIFLMCFTFFLGYNFNKYFFYINKKIDKEIQVELINEQVEKGTQTEIDLNKINELLVHEKDINDINKGIYKWTIL